MRKFSIIIMLLSSVGCASGPCRGVLGLSYSTQSGTVDYAFKGSPAEKLGIDTGDILLEAKSYTGPVGTPVHVKILRNGKLMEFDTQLMCIDDLSDEVVLKKFDMKGK